MTTSTLQKWHTDKIGNLGKVVTGKTPPTAHKEFYSGEFPFITPSDISTFDVRYLSETERTISNLWASKNKKYILPRDAITYVCIGSTVGKIGLTEKESITNQQINALVANPLKLVPQYGYYLLRNITPEIQQIASARGAGKGIINKSQFEDFDVTVPSVDDQQSIADILSRYDDLIENNTRRIQILEQIAQATYTEWFVNFHFPDHEKVKMTDSSTDFGKIPQGWTVKKLGEQIDIYRGKNITKKTIEKGNVPVVAGGLEPAYYHSTANTEAPVVTVSASGANAGFVNLYMENVWASDCSYIDKGVTPFVLYYFLLLKSRQIEVTGLQRGSAQPHVYPKDLSELLVVDVPDHLLESFEDIVGTIFSFVGNLKKQNKALRDSRDLLLPKLVTGGIVVK